MGWVFRSNASIRKNYLFRKLLVHTDALYSLHLIAKIDATSGVRQADGRL